MSSAALGFTCENLAHRPMPTFVRLAMGWPIPPLRYQLARVHRRASNDVFVVRFRPESVAWPPQRPRRSDAALPNRAVLTHAIESKPRAPAPWPAGFVRDVPARALRRLAAAVRHILTAAIPRRGLCLVRPLLKSSLRPRDHLSVRIRLLLLDR